MKIQELLEQEHSKLQTTRVTNYVGDNPQRFKELLQIFMKGDYRLVQRAAWPLSYCVMAHPALIKPYYKQLLKKLEAKDQHPAVTRNILRLFQDVDIPDTISAALLDQCFAFMTSELQPAAIRAFAITVAARICAPYPELKKELILVLNELRLYPQLPAVTHRIKKALKDLESA